MTYRSAQNKLTASRVRKLCRLEKGTSMKNAIVRTVTLKRFKKLMVSHDRGYVLLEILSMTQSQTANGKNETFAVCHRLFVH